MLTDNVNSVNNANYFLYGMVILCCQLVTQCLVFALSVHEFCIIIL